MTDAEFQQRLTADFPDGVRSANQIRLEYGIGANRATEQYRRWLRLAASPVPAADPPQ